MNGPVRKENRKLITQLLVMAVVMFGFGWALIPLYDVFCEVTGFGGRTNTKAFVPAASMQVDESRLVTVQFVSNVAQDGEWEFRPQVATMRVHPGKMYTTHYVARNLRDFDTAGQAVPSVSPGNAARYFQKVECFCFTRQDFEGHELKDMPVVFMVDPELPAHIGTVTLGYTFFDARG
jgi:cytochrome c oxidase assembly protein subunit 11